MRKHSRARAATAFVRKVIRLVRRWNRERVAKKLLGHVFAADWYVAQYPEVARTGLDPLVHYMRWGATGGLDPHPFFSTRWYVTRYPDVLSSGMNPLQHYVRVGASEQRIPHPLLDPTSGDVLNAENGQDSSLAQPFAFNPKGPENPWKRWFRESQAEVSPDEAATRYQQLTHRTPPHAKAIEAHAPVAVIFLARSADGSTRDFLPFFKSYHDHDAGTDHDLIVIRKGRAQESGSRQSIENLLCGRKAQYIDFDDSGYDLQAYLKAAALLPHETLSFFNSHSEIRAGDWLRKLVSPLRDQNVGLVGATASYESISDSIEITAKVAWLIREGYDCGPEILRLFAEDVARAREGRPSPSVPRPASPDLALASLADFDQQVHYASFLQSATAPGEILHEFLKFPRFPNPHVRTNGFAIRRELLLSFGFQLSDEKLDCVFLESGTDGLSRRVLSRGLRQVLVGADGRNFEIEDWPSSGTFRLEGQRNVLVSDNRVKEWETASPDEQERLAVMTWGEYVAPVPEDVKDIGFPFASRDLQFLPGSED